jgi:hypothetical protein
MTSVRMLAAGAVTLFALIVLTAPVRACDDRFIKKCEAESEAAFLAEQQPATTATARRKTQRARTTFEKPAAPRTRAPRFIARTNKPAVPEPMTLASDEQRAVADSALTRRFRGFIDPQPMTGNSFEDLRRPWLDAEHLTPPATLPVNDAVAAADETVGVSTAVAPAEIAAPPPPQAAAAVAAAPTPVFAQAAAASSDEGAPSGFPFHKLVLTLCGALGVASALRFIVRA